MTQFEVQLLTPEELETYWPFISQELDRIPHTWNLWWTKNSLYNGAMLGNFQVWAIGPPKEIRFVLFTQIANYPANKILQGILMLGNSVKPGLEVLEATLEGWARLQHCTVMELTGRPGWERVLSRFGMRKSGVVLSRPIHAERIQ